MVTEFPWIAVSGFGAHIKATATTLIIQNRGTIEEYPLDSVKNLLIIGGHTLNSAVVLNLLRHDACITFFDADGTPAGSIRPTGNRGLYGLGELQKTIPRQRFATAIAQAALQARLFFMEREEEERNIRLFYEGELELFQKSRQELPFLIRLEEIRRLHRLVSDMYYEVIARSLPPELGFRRRSKRPHTDPVNAMLSYGYALLFGAGMPAAIGAGLDPDQGMLHEGKNSLVYDVIDPLRTGMVDRAIFRIAREGLDDRDYDLTPGRCILSEDLIHAVNGQLRASVSGDVINRQALGLADAIRDGSALTVLY